LLTVTDKNGFSPWKDFTTVNHIIKSAEFILVVDHLDHSIGIDLFFKIIESIQVHAVKSFCRMPFRDIIVRDGKGWSAEKSKSGAVSGNKIVT